MSWHGAGPGLGDGVSRLVSASASLADSVTEESRPVRGSSSVSRPLSSLSVSEDSGPASVVPASVSVAATCRFVLINSLSESEAKSDVSVSTILTCLITLYVTLGFTVLGGAAGCGGSGSGSGSVIDTWGIGCCFLSTFAQSPPSTTWDDAAFSLLVVVSKFAHSDDGLVPSVDIDPKLAHSAAPLSALTSAGAASESDSLVQVKSGSLSSSVGDCDLGVGAVTTISVAASSGAVTPGPGPAFGLAGFTGSTKTFTSMGTEL